MYKQNKQSTDISECKDKLKKLYGLKPYDGSTNYVKNDGYFKASIERDYSSETIKQAKKELEKWLVKN